MADPVKIAIELAGADAAEQSLLRLQGIIEKLNAGASGYGPGAAASTGPPFGVPPGTAGAPDPYSGYSFGEPPGFGPGPTNNPFADIMDGFLHRPGNSYAAPPPPAAAPHPFKTGGDYTGSSFPDATDSAIPPDFQPFGSSRSGFQQVMDMMGWTRMANKMGLGNVLGGVGGDALGAAGGGMAAEGVLGALTGPIGIALAVAAIGTRIAGGVAGLGLNAYGAYTQPGFQAGLQIESIQQSGQYISPITQAAMHGIAQYQGDIGLAHVVTGLLDKTGLPVTQLYDLFAGRQIQQRITDIAASGDLDTQLARSYRMVGQNGLANTLLSDAQNNQVDQLRLPDKDAFAVAMQASNMAMPFGTRAGASWLNGSNRSAIDALLNSGYQQSDILNSVHTVLGYAQQPQFADVWRRYSQGSMGYHSLERSMEQEVIFRGDYAAAASMRSAFNYDPGRVQRLRMDLQDPTLSPSQRTQYQRALDSELANQTSYDDFLGSVNASAATQNQLSIGQSVYSAQQSRVAGMQASGANLIDVSMAQSQQITTLQEIRDLTKQMLDRTASPAERQQLQATIASLNASIAQTRAAAFQTAYSASTFTTQAAELGASNLMTEATYGRNASFSGIYSAFGAQISADMQAVQNAQFKLNDPSISPQERAYWQQVLQQAQLKVSVADPRAIGQTVIQQTQGQINIAGAQTGMGLTQAGLFGGPSDIYGATVANAQATMGGQINLLNRELAPGNPFNLSPQELQSAQADLIRTTNELNRTLTEAQRSFNSLQLSVSQTTYSIGQMQTGMQISSFGVGGTQAAGLALGNIGQAGDVLSKAQAQLETLQKQGVSPNNPAYVQAQQAVTQAQQSYFSGENSMANLPMSASFQREQLSNQFQINAMTSTYAQWGDIRGALTEQMGLIGQQLQTLNSNRQTALSQVYDDLKGGKITPDQLQGRLDSVNLSFDQQKYSLGNQAIQAQNQLEYGWQDRLISSVVNMPERGAFVASQFTQFEAAPWLQNIAPNFGFGGAGGPAARDYYMRTVPQLAQSLIGNVSRREGFMSTAMSGATPPGPGGTMQDWYNLARTANSPLTPNGGMPPGGMLIHHTPTSTQIQVDVHVSDDRTRVTVKDKNGNPIANGQGASAVHAVINSPNLPPAFASGVSHQ